MNHPIACVHCGGIANHRPLADGTDCPTARTLAELRRAADAVRSVAPLPKVNGPAGGKA